MYESEYKQQEYKPNDSLCGVYDRCIKGLTCLFGADLETDYNEIKDGEEGKRQMKSALESLKHEKSPTGKEQRLSTVTDEFARHRGTILALDAGDDTDWLRDWLDLIETKHTGEIDALRQSKDTIIHDIEEKKRALLHVMVAGQLRRSQQIRCENALFHWKAVNAQIEAIEAARKEEKAAAASAQIAAVEAARKEEKAAAASAQIEAVEAARKEEKLAAALAQSAAVETARKEATSFGV